MKTNSYVLSIPSRFLWILIVVSLAPFSFTHAQKANWNADIEPIPSDGFYQLPLSPQVLSKANNQFHRIRIFEGKTEIPYLIKKKEPQTSRTYFKTLPILENINNDSLGYLILANSDLVKLSALQLKIEKAWVTKRLKISGSNDKKSWFVVRSSFSLTTNETINSDETSFLYTIELPLTNYNYYKLETDNKENLALNIRSVGYFEQETKSELLTKLPTPTIQQIATKDSRSSLFQISFKEKYLVSRLVFNVKSPRLFHRNARLFKTNPLAKKPDNEFITNLLLSSKDTLSKLELNDVSTDSFFLWIDNQNNPPLEFSEILAFQSDYYLTSYLEKGKSYRFQIGPDSLETPIYDLVNFDNQITTTIPTLTLSELKKATPQVAEPVSEPFFKSKLWIWIGIILVGALIAYMSVKMVREM